MAKTLTQQHAELVELHGAKVGELAAAVAEITALKAAAVESDAKAAALAAQLKSAGDESARLAAELAAVTTERDALKSDCASAKAEAEKVKAELELRPAVSTDGAAPVADGGEASGKSILDQYKAITDPAEKTAFYRKHKSDLWAGK